MTSGPFISRHRGHGLDFDDLRLYSPGDDVRHIDWKVTARYGQAHTRLYREERDSTVTTAVDLRRVMCTGTDSLRAVNAGLLSAAIAWHAASLGQRSAVFVLTDTEIFTALPLAGDAGALRVCRTLCDAFDAQQSWHQSETQEKQLTLNALLDALVLAGRQLGATVVLTGFDDHFDQSIDTNLAQGLSILNARYQRHTHPLCAVQMLDTLENEALPSGRYGYSIDGAFASIKSRTRFLQPQQRAALTQSLTAQKQQVLDLCDTHSINCITHIGKATDASISRLLAQLGQYGLFV